MTTPQQRLQSRQWRFFSSAWLLTPMLTFGILTCFAFLWVGLRLRSRSVLLSSAGYLAVTVFFFAVATSAPDPPDRPVDDVALLLLLVAWIGGTVHAFHVNRRYLVLKAEEASLGWSAEPVRPSRPQPAQGDAAERLGLTADQSALWGGAPAAAAPAIPATTAPAQPAPTPARPAPAPPPPRAATGPTALPPTWAPAVEPAAPPSPRPVDLNSATEAELQAVPGVGPVLAGRIVAEREARGGFGSVQDLSALVPPHVLVRLAEQVVVAPRPAPGRRPRARIVDV